MASGSVFPEDEELRGVPWVQEIEPQSGVVPSIEELRERERRKHERLDEWLKRKES